MSKKIYQAFVEMREMLGDTELLEALYDALTIDEVIENLEYIDRCYDLGVFDEEEDEEEDEDE